MISDTPNKSEQQGRGEGPECCFRLPMSAWGSPVASAEGENGVIGAVPGQEGSPLSEGISPLQPAVSLQASAAGGGQGRRQCVGRASSSPAGHLTVRCLERQGGELVVHTEKGMATPVSAGTGTNLEAKEEGAALASCLCAQRMAHQPPPPPTPRTHGK